MAAARYRLTRAWLALGNATLPVLAPAAVAHLRRHPHHRLVITPTAPPDPGHTRPSLLLWTDPDTGRIRAEPADPWHPGRPRPDSFYDPAWMTQAANTINTLQGDP